MTCSTTETNRTARTAQSTKALCLRNAEYASRAAAPRNTSRLPARCPMRKAIMTTPVTAMTIFLPTVVRQYAITEVI
jgi:hypothetical protein